MWVVEPVIIWKLYVNADIKGGHSCKTDLKEKEEQNPNKLDYFPVCPLKDFG